MFMVTWGSTARPGEADASLGLASDACRRALRARDGRAALGARPSAIGSGHVDHFSVVIELHCGNW